MRFESFGILSAVLIAITVILFILSYARKKRAGGNYTLTPIIFRAISAILLILAISEPYLEKGVEEIKATLLIDISDSMDPALTDSVINRAKAVVGESVITSVIPFAKASSPIAISIKDIDSLSKLRSSWSNLDIGETDIESALNRAVGQDSSAILLISDGRETEGEMFRSALFQSGVPIFPFAPDRADTGVEGFRISHMYAPLVSPAKSSVEVRVGVINTASSDKKGGLVIKHDDKIIFDRSIALPAGSEEAFVAKTDPSIEGVREVTAVLTPSDGDISSYTVYVSGEKREKILILSEEEKSSSFLKKALEGKAYQITEMNSSRQPIHIKDLFEYSVIIFNNISFGSLDRSITDKLGKFIEDGGGFIMIGGDRSFGLGGYINTPIEEVLPVELVPPQTEQKRLNIAVQLIVDKSRSMAFDDRIEFAKSATKETIKNLKDDDYVGVIGFDSSPFIVLRLGQLRDIRASAMDRVERLFASGRTVLLPAMDEGRRALERINAGRKHMIILTDGKLPDGGPHYVEMVKQIRILGITVSTVLVGSEGDDGLLAQMAEVGGGAFYHTVNPNALPRIFIQDIKVTGGERTLKESLEYIVRRGPSSLVSTSIESYPPLRGYVQTRPKRQASLELVLFSGQNAEPLLASWNYGRGKSIAFTSDSDGRWSNYWVSWQRYARFWGDLVESARAESDSKGEQIKFDLTYELKAGELIVNLMIFSGEPEGSVLGTFTLPDGTEKEAIFTKIVPGRYTTAISSPKAGRYLFVGKIGEKATVPVAFYLSGELFGERKGLGFDTVLLDKLASSTGGKINPTLEDLQRGSEKLVKKEEIYHYFLLAALIFLCLEVVVREVSFTTSVFQYKGTSH